MRSLSAHYECIIKSIEPRTGSYILYCTDDDTDDIAFNTSVTVNDYHQWATPDPCRRNAHEREVLKRLRKEGTETQYAAILAHIDHALNDPKIHKRLRPGLARTAAQQSVGAGGGEGATGGCDGLGGGGGLCGEGATGGLTGWGGGPAVWRGATGGLTGWGEPAMWRGRREG